MFIVQGAAMSLTHVEEVTLKGSVMGGHRGLPKFKNY